MSSTGYVFLAILTLFGGLVASLLVASIPQLFNWDFACFRSMICHIMAFVLLVYGLIGCGLLISEAYNKRKQK